MIAGVPPHFLNGVSCSPSPRGGSEKGDLTITSPKRHLNITFKPLKHVLFVCGSPFSDPPLGDSDISSIKGCSAMFLGTAWGKAISQSRALQTVRAAKRW